MARRGKRKAARRCGGDSEEEISEEEQEEVGANGDDANGESQSEEDEPEEKIPVKRGRPPKRAKRTEEPLELSLLEICKNHQNAVSSAAKSWVERCTRDRSAAVAELLTLILQATGSDHVVTNEELDAGEIDDLVADVKKEISEDGYVDYFKGKGHKGFVSSYLQFWDLIVQFCYEADILLDDPIIDAVCRLSTGLSSSDVRFFRYVGTVTACHVATSLIKVSVALSDDRDTAQRQDQAETRKKGGKGAQERGRAFRKAAEKCHSQINELHEHVEMVFQSVTTNRFRDTHDEVRAIVIEAVGNWCEFLPAVFLKDLYLKYLGWALSDQAGLVREAATDALLGLYYQESNLGSMHEFTERFKPRFLELPNDVDDNVAVKGVKLLTVLVKKDEISSAEVSGRYNLLLEENVVLRFAAAELVSESLVDTGKEYILKLQEGQKGRRKSIDNIPQEELCLAGLQHIYATLSCDLTEEEEEEPSVTFGLALRIVDALYDRVDVLHDWKGFSKALLDDKACEKRGSLATLHLGFLLQASVQRACTGSLDLSSHGNRKQIQRKALTAIENEKHELTLAMTDNLLPLLTKHQANPFLAAAVVSVIQHLDLELFSLRKAEETLKNILLVTASLFGKHSQPELIRACSHALQHCASPDGISAQEPGHSIFAKLVSESASSFQNATLTLLGLSDEDLDNLPDSEEDEEILAANACLLRVYNLLLTASNPSGDSRVQESLSSLLKDAVNHCSIPPQITMKALQSQALVIIWGLQLRLSGLQASADLSERVSEFIKEMSTLMLMDNLSVKAMCIRTLSDLYQIFSLNALKDSAESLVIKGNTEDLVRLWTSADQILSENIELDDEDNTEENEAHSKEISKLKKQVAFSIARLILHKVEPFVSKMPGRLLSYLESSDSSLSSAVAEFSQHLKKMKGKEMPLIHAQAIITCFERVGEHSSQLKSLTKKIANTYTAFVSNASNSALQVLTAVESYVFQGNVKQQAPILGSLQPFISKLSAKDLDTEISGLQKKAEENDATQDDSTWDGLFDLIRAGEDRQKKQKSPKSALRKPNSGGKQPGRRISFKDANKIQRPSGRGVNKPEDDREVIENTSSDEEDEKSQYKSPMPRFHEKTRRGSQILSPPLLRSSEKSRNEDHDSDEDSEEFGDEERQIEDEEGEEEENRTPVDLIVPQSVEQVPSGLFLAESVGLSVDQRSEEEDEEEEDEEVSLPRIRYNRA